MLESLKHIDTAFFLFLNGKHNAFWDVVMFRITKEISSLPLYIILLFLIYKKEREKMLWILLSVGILITLSDQLSVHVFKNVFLRYRPTHNLNLEGLVHTVNEYYGGQYGFISSHAANTFALATFISLLLQKHYKYITVLLFAWAAFISYSRIYLGVHYPADVAVGALFGTALALAVYKFYIYSMNRFIKTEHE